MNNRPAWYKADHDQSWDRVKAAFRNDWEQTKHDFGSNTARDLDQDVNDTVKQATGTEDAFEKHENAFRFGHAAQSQYRTQYPTWNNDLDTRLRQDYGTDYDRDRMDIRRAYEYRSGSSSNMAADDRTGRDLR
jgi:hypothetical protein